MNPATTYLLYFVFATGGAGLYYLLPQGGRSKTLIGAMLGGSALVALLIVLGVRGTSPDPARGYFLLFSTLAIVGTVRVITHKKPVYSAAYFVLVVIAVAALLVLQQAEFLAVALIIIYAGAILVTYLFVIMLAQQSGTPVHDVRSREPLAAVVVGFVLMAAIAVRAGDGVPPKDPAPRSIRLAASGVGDSPDRTAIPEGNTLALGAALTTRYVVVLEIAGVLLLISMIGAIALSRKRIPMEDHSYPTRPIGQVGREVKPF